MSFPAAMPERKDQAEDKLCRQAAAFRAKYQVGDPQRVPPGQIGFHPANRGGEPPNGDRCKTLCKAILSKGFDKDEADFGGLLVQDKSGSSRFHDYNVNVCAGNADLAPMVAGLVLSLGSLAHSHLNQIFKNILIGIDMGVQELEKRDSLFAHYCKTGALWTILSPKMEDEEPDAPNILQAAANVKHGMAMQAHLLEGIRILTTWVTAEAAASRAVTFAGAKEKLSLTLGHITEGPDFLHIFRFAVDIGANKSPYLPDLADFTSKFVDPQVCAMLVVSHKASSKTINY